MASSPKKKDEKRGFYGTLDRLIIEGVFITNNADRRVVKNIAATLKFNDRYHLWDASLKDFLVEYHWKPETVSPFWENEDIHLALGGNFSFPNDIEPLLLKIRNETRFRLEYLRKIKSDEEPFLIQNQIVIGDDGIYRKEDKIACYPIKGGRLKIVKYLLENKKATGDELQTVINNNASEVSKAIKEINKNFMDKLTFANNLVIHRKASGYGIDKKRYEIVENFEDF